MRWFCIADFTLRWRSFRRVEISDASGSHAYKKWRFAPPFVPSLFERMLAIKLFDWQSGLGF